MMLTNKNRVFMAVVIAVFGAWLYSIGRNNIAANQQTNTGLMRMEAQIDAIHRLSLDSNQRLKNFLGSADR